MTVIEEVRGFLAQELGIDGAQEIDPDLGLVQKGLIDSIELMQVVAFLETRFGIRIEDTEILPVNLRSLSAMAAFIEQKLSASAAALQSPGAR
ncbi:MAG TPA: acyl carrier protein [Thermoanaerobaculia bacterium]|nr:acyl carrier protein [Thermoanaerobaculia bacterium]